MNASTREQAFDAALSLMAEGDPAPDPVAIARREERDELRRIACLSTIARADAGQPVDAVYLADARAFVEATPPLNRPLGTGEQTA